MSKRQILMLLGLLTIALALFSGFPPLWNTILYIILGLLVIVTAYLMKPAHSPVEPSAPYVEHTPVPPSEGQQ